MNTLKKTNKSEIKSIYKEGINFDPVKLADSWVVLNKSAFIDSVNQIPFILHESMLKKVKNRFLNERK